MISFVVMLIMWLYGIRHRVKDVYSIGGWKLINYYTLISASSLEALLKVFNSFDLAIVL